VGAEQRHAAYLEDLLKTRDLPVPANRWAGADVPTYATRQEACAAAVEFEVRNVALYDKLLADRTLPADVKAVFEHNRMASLDHHKVAFERCVAGGRGRGGQGYGRGGRGLGPGGQGQGRGGCGRGRGGGRGRCCWGGGAPTSSGPAESGS
jgi:hypothetical protein